MLSSLQQECADRLAADPLFAHVPVITEKLKDIESAIAVALGPLNSAGKVGMCIILLTPFADADYENVPGPVLNDVRVLARVLENPTINKDANSGTLVPAADAIEKVVQLLHQFYPLSASGPLVSVKPSIRIGDDPNNLSYDASFRCTGTLSVDLTQAAAPVLVNNAGVITATCATAGAAIFYTIDGKNASPRNGTFYSAPFTPGAGKTVKARAWLAGYLASETTTLNT